MKQLMIYFRKTQMSKTLSLGLLLLFSLNLQSLSAQSTKRWKMVWEENFDAQEIDYSVWSKIPRGTSNWNDTMSDQERLFEIRDGKLILKGIVNDERRLITRST